MAWAYIGGNAATQTTAITQGVTTGELLIVYCFDANANNEVLTLADNAGGGTNTYSSIDTCNDGTHGNTLQWWYAIAKGTETLTITVSGGSASLGMNLGTAHYSGNDPAPFDQHAINPVAGNASVAGSAATNGDTGTAVVPTTNGSLVISTIFDTTNFGVGGTPEFSSGTSPIVYTLRSASTNDAGNSTACFAFEDFIQTTAASITPTWTAKNTDTYVCFTASFKVLGVSAPSIAQSFPAMIMATAHSTIIGRRSL